MPVDDLWYLSKRDPNGERIPSKRPRAWKRYRVRWVDEMGKTQTKFFDRKIDADRHDANVRADLSRGQYIDPGAGKLTFGAYAERWRQRQVHRDSTRVQVEGHLRRYILPHLGTRQLASVRPSDVQAWVQRLTTELEPATIEVVYARLSAIFKAAVRDRHIAASPCVDIKRPKVTPSRVEPLPVELVHALIDAVPPRYRALLMVGAGCGLRQGEAFGLEVEHVEFLRRGGPTLKVDQQLTLISGAPPFLAPPKTASSYRTLPIGQVLTEALASHLARFPAREVEIVDRTGRKPISRAARLIFTSAEGDSIRRTTFGKAWRRAVRVGCATYVAAATTPGARTDAEAAVRRFEQASFHDLRHFYASLLIAEGAPVTEVQARLGHASATETLNCYSHLWPDSDARTRTAVDRVLGGPQESRGDDLGCTGVVLA
jgi:integrase